MNMLNAEPAPDFTDPLGLLMACHQRMLGNCETLEALLSHIETSGVDEEARKAARNVHHYFSTAGMLHHADEEQDLFPLLIRESIKMAEIIHALKQDHKQMMEAWQALAPLLARPNTIEPGEKFTQTVMHFCTLYRDHIKREESDFLDIARHILSSAQLKKLGSRMKERREQAAEHE
jgi:hemerythrin-like domain-containing protein